jgi:hypothetical protein
MATKTISVHIAAYERLRAARAHAGESFSDVILRAEWPGRVLLGRDLLAAVQARGPVLSPATLAELEEQQRLDRAPEDKWKRASSSRRRS